MLSRRIARRGRPDRALLSSPPVLAPRGAEVLRPSMTMKALAVPKACRQLEQDDAARLHPAD
jgi:hypothetical protein